MRTTAGNVTIYPDTANLIQIVRGDHGPREDFFAALPDGLVFVFTGCHPWDLMTATPDEQEAVVGLIDSWPDDHRRWLDPEEFRVEFPGYEEILFAARDKRLLERKLMMSLGNTFSKAAVSQQAQWYEKRGIGEDLNSELEGAYRATEDHAAQLEALAGSMTEHEWLRLCFSQLPDGLKEFPGVSEFLASMSDNPTVDELKHAVEKVMTLALDHQAAVNPFQMIELGTTELRKNRQGGEQVSAVVDTTHLQIVWQHLDEV